MRPRLGEPWGKGRLGSRVSLTFLLGAGVVGTLAFLYLFLTDTVGVGTMLPERVIEVLLLGVPATGLVCAGIWLRYAGFHHVRVWRIGQYALGGTVVAAITGSLLLALFSPRPFGIHALFFLLVSAATEGALIGFIVGWIATSGAAIRIDSPLQPRERPADGPWSGPAGDRPEGRSQVDTDDRSTGTVEAHGDTDERLEELVAFLSHDLRNPLNVAQLRLELAREEGDLDHLEGVARAHDRMEALIEDLLRLSGDDDLEAEPVELAAAAADAWSNVDTGEATLVVEADRTVRADPTRLGRLLENLFRNAVRHGGPDVTVTVGDLEDGFYVEDDGRGIPPGERDDVFELGYSNDDGTGLGLPIVRRITGEHGWSVTVVEGEDGGARFEITEA